MIYLNKDQPDTNNPYFFCTVTDKATIAIGSLSPTKVKFTIAGDTLEFASKGKEMSDASLSDIKNDYFQVTKGATQGKRQVVYSTTNDSEITCQKGKGA